MFVTVAAAIASAPDAMLAAAREAMIESQLKPCGVISTRLVAALYAVPREDFVAPSRRALAYSDSAQALGADSAQALGARRELMPPLSLGHLLQAAAARPDDRVLVVGAATGYSAAILSHLANSVTALESDPALASSARSNLADLGVSIAEGPLEAGWPAAGPYSLILIDGAIELLPPSLVAQLAEGGRVAAILVGSDGVSRAALGSKRGSSVHFEPVAAAGAAILSPFRKPAVFRF